MTVTSQSLILFWKLWISKLFKNEVVQQWDGTSKIGAIDYCIQYIY